MQFHVGFRMGKNRLHLLAGREFPRNFLKISGTWTEYQLRALWHLLLVLVNRERRVERDVRVLPKGLRSTTPTWITKYVSREDFLQQILAQVETAVRVVVRQELELRLEAVLGPHQSSQRCSPVNRPDSSTSRSLQLIFANKLQSTFYTDSKIVAEGHSFITVQLVDANSREVIHYAPFGSVGVKIFAIRGDFAVDGQEDQSDKALDGGIVHEREGRRPLLFGDLAFSLTHGVGFIKNVVFTDNSSWLRSGKFRLGVRAVPTTLNRVLIKEGISEAFVVKDRRGESSQKHSTPQLDDPLWRLNRISKSGAVCTVLAGKGIHTVKDFLQLYHVNPKLLRDTVGSGLGDKTWESIVKHANKCCLGNDIYSYYHAADDIGFLVNSVYKVLGVTFDGINYQAIDALDPQQMVLVEQLKQYIYDNPDVLYLESNSSSTHSSVLSQFQKNDPVCGPSLDHWVNATSNVIPITNQGNKLDVSHSYPSCSNPYTIYGSYQQEEDIATHSAQLIERGEWGSWSQPSNEAYDWNSPNPMVLTALPDPFTLEENCLTQTSPWHPVGTWATASGGNAEFSCLLRTSGSNPAGGKSKACWLKVRSVLMWKVVKRLKRDAGAKKKGKFLLGHYGYSGNKLDVSHSYPSCSNPYTIYGSYQQEEDIATHSAQPIDCGEWGSWSQPNNEAYDWNLLSPMVLTALPDTFTLEENFLTQTSPLHQFGTWATASGGNAEFSCLLQTSGSNPAGGKSKACWLKVRSVLMWKVVKRDAAAKKKGKSLFKYYHGLCV